MIYPNWLMCISEGFDPGATVYVDGLDYSIEDSNLVCDIESSDLYIAIENNDPGATVYVDGLDYSIEDSNLVCDIESSDLYISQ